VRLLSEPDPSAPFLQTVDGKQIPMVREVVRVNHLRNCLLCHAPSTSDKDVVVGPIPTPGAPLPPSQVYYAKRNGEIVVRADITYLKQDFSVMQPVDKPGAWPDKQRYDYLVRIRPLNDAERAVFEGKNDSGKARPLSEHKAAILYALRALTGQDVGDSPQAWQELVTAKQSEQPRSDK
jgi:hypothetical protein